MVVRYDETGIEKFEFVFDGRTITVFTSTGEDFAMECAQRVADKWQGL